MKLSNKIYLDENSASRILVNLLEKSGFEVKTPEGAHLMGQDDATQLAYAAKHDCILLTKNPADFIELHHQNPRHAGIVGIYQDNDIKKDIGYHEIASTMQQLIQMKVPIKGQFIVLNHYRKSRR